MLQYVNVSKGDTVHGKLTQRCTSNSFNFFLKKEMSELPSHMGVLLFLSRTRNLGLRLGVPGLRIIRRIYTYSHIYKNMYKYTLTYTYISSSMKNHIRDLYM